MIFLIFELATYDSLGDRSFPLKKSKVREKPHSRQSRPKFCTQWTHLVSKRGTHSTRDVFANETEEEKVSIRHHFLQFEKAEVAKSIGFFQGKPDMETVPQKNT